MIGHERLGSGPRAVIVMNDWICDTSTWDGARAYLDAVAFTWVFADLRGYGRSRGQGGELTVRHAGDGDRRREANELSAIEARRTPLRRLDPIQGGPLARER